MYFHYLFFYCSCGSGSSFCCSYHTLPVPKPGELSCVSRDFLLSPASSSFMLLFCSVVQSWLPSLARGHLMISLLVFLSFVLDTDYPERPASLLELYFPSNLTLRGSHWPFPWTHWSLVSNSLLGLSHIQSVLLWFWVADAEERQSCLTPQVNIAWGPILLSLPPKLRSPDLYLATSLVFTWMCSNG